MIKFLLKKIYFKYPKLYNFLLLLYKKWKKISDGTLKYTNKRLYGLIRFVKNNTRIDLVEKNGVYLFCYVDDWFYKYSIKPECRNKDYKLLKNIKNKPVSPCTPSEYINDWKGPSNADKLLLAHMTKYLDSYTLLDVGCLYGYTTIVYARFLERIGANARIMCFDPGNAAELASYNFYNNGFDNIEFYPYAVSEFNGYMVIHSEPGQNENNRIFNPRIYEYATSRIKKGISLDSFLPENKIDTDLFIKMDTQGAEPEIFEGLVNTISNKNVSGILEFCPGRYDARIPPEKFLNYLIDNFYIYDLGPRRDRIQPINHDQANTFIEKVRNDKYAWADLLFISTKLPGVESLVKKFDQYIPGH